jgi:hypothetical protein
VTGSTQSLSQALISFLEESVPLKLSDDPDPAAHHWKQGRVSASLVARQKAYAQLRGNVAYYVGRYDPSFLDLANKVLLEGLTARNSSGVATGLEIRTKNLLLGGLSGIYDQKFGSKIVSYCVGLGPSVKKSL